MKLLFHVESSPRNDPMEIILFFEIRGNGLISRFDSSFLTERYIYTYRKVVFREGLLSNDRIGISSSLNVFLLTLNYHVIAWFFFYFKGLSLDSRSSVLRRLLTFHDDVVTIKESIYSQR